MTKELFGILVEQALENPRATLTAELVVKTPQGEKSINTKLQSRFSIKNRLKDDLGVIVKLHLIDQTDYTGYFNGFDDDSILLKSCTSNTIIGIPLNSIEFYFEEIKEGDENE